MEIVTAFIKEFVEPLMVPVKKHLGYMISCTKYVRDMSIKMRELNVARQGVEDHLNWNTRTRLKNSVQVRKWLEDVGQINEKVENISNNINNVGSCFNLKDRHMLGKKVSSLIEDIDSAKTQHSLIDWTNYPIPLGKVDSMMIPTSIRLSHHNDFQSRIPTFIEALKALGPNHKSHMIALWGMGGVGKTTMMQMIKRAVKEKKMFNFIVEAVVGEKTEPHDIQEAVANYLGIELKENTQPARAEKLRESFEAISDGGKNKFLIILDDVWQSVDMEDIGLSPLPNQGVNFKVLMTSRNRDVCTKMGVETNSILNVKILTEEESQGFFRQFVELSNDVDPELNKIGEDIVSKCCGLPIAIKTMVCTLRNKSKDAWNDALSRLEHHDIHNVVPKVFEMSYDNLQGQETKSIFLLCGLFPEDFDIPTEDLVKYGLGLKLFSRVYTIIQARTRLNACIERLMHTNLLIKSDKVDCVKMHDLVHAFVLDMFSAVDHSSIVSQSTMSGWPESDISVRSCKRISLTCKGMSEFPRDLKFRNLSLLKLMHGDKSLRFPRDFYEEMENLQVISFDKMKYPLLPSSLQCSTNLRVLHLQQCSLMFDCSSIGNMLNLEVLSFANSGIELLPWTIGNLKKLKLLDLTDCGGLRIDNGVFKNLVKLQELYTICGYPPDNRIKFTDDNCNEIAEGSKNLYAFEFEFFRNNALPKNMSFENIERFKISVGCALDGNISKTKHSFENTLQLVVNKDEILESRMNELFQKTEALCLTVEDMNDLEDIGFKPSHPLHTSSFYKLRVLVVSECAELRYLFTLGIAKALQNIEQLDVESCVNMEELIHTGSNAEEIITFPKLKFLSLRWLPVLSGLSHSVKIIELPQLVELRLCGIPNITGIYTNDKFATSCFFKEEVMIPNLEKLYIFYMENLKELWPCEFRITEEVKLREIEVRYCDNLVNLFPCNPTPLLHHLEALELWDCGSIEVLFNIDLDCVSEIGEEDSNSSSLRSIKVQRFGKLTEVWRIKGADNSPHLIRDFITVESIDIRSCNMFRNVFTPVVTNFDLSALTEIFIHDCGESERNNELMECIQEEKLNIVQKEDTSRVINDISNVVIPMCHMHSFRNLRSLELWGYEGVEAVFQIEGPQSRELVTTQNNQQLLPYLEELHMTFMERMSHVWKCNWNNFLITQKTHLESPFNNLTTIHMIQCKSIKYLFSPLMAKLLSKLKKVEVSDCDGIEEIVSNRDDEEKTKTDSTNTSTSLFTHFDSLTLSGLNNLKHIGGSVSNHRSNQLSFNNTTTTNAFLDQLSQVGGVCWTLCQYSREIRISRCHTLSSVIPSYAVGNMQKLQVLKIESCSLMKEIFETQDINDHNSSFHSAEETVGTPTIPGLSNVIKFKLMNLKILEIKDCSCLEHIFTFSALESLGQLEKLKIENCIAMQVIVKEEPGDQTRKTNDLVFRRLKSIALVNLPNLMSFFLGTNDFRWPLLDDVMIKDCPKMMVFTSGQSIAPKLKYIHTRFGKYSLDCGLNFPVTTTSHQTLFPVLGNTSSSSATSEGIPWSFQNLITLDLAYNKFVVKIIPSKESLQLQKLEKIHVRQCVMLEEVFEALEGTNSGFVKLVKLPNLREVELLRLKRLRHIWKSNQWTIFEFPNLTRVSIDYCDGLQHVFTSSMVGSLLQLQELHISYCDNMEEVIVSDVNVVVEEEEDGKVNEILLPRLRSLEIDSVPCLKGFCLGKEDFSLPLLSTLSIKKCPTITIFTKGNSATPELKEIETSFGSFHAREDINAFIKIKQKEFTDADR